MIKDILKSKGLSVYKVSKETNISYSTLNDIVIEKTDIKKEEDMYSRKGDKSSFLSYN